MHSPTARSILRREAFGFSLILALIWLTELFRVPHHFFGEPDEFNWLRVLLRTGVTIVIWAWVHHNSRRLLNRLHELEGFLLVCSWCRRVGHKGGWMTMEEYFGSRLATETSHGICPECAVRLSGHPTAERVPPRNQQNPTRGKL
jgi:hypothetical protein